MIRVRRLFRCEAGTAAIEFAFIGLLLITVTVGIIEVGRALFMLNELSHAADRAARGIMLNFEVPEDSLRDLARDENFLTGLVPGTMDLVSPVPGTGEPFRNVRLSYPFTPMVSGLTIGTITLSTDRQVAR